MYTSESIPLAMCEIGLEIDDIKTLRDTHACVGFSFDEDLVEELPEKDYPDDWNTTPHGREARRIGDEWVKNMSSAVLKVPSVHGGYNYLLNPSHPDFSKIDISATKLLSEKLPTH